MEGIHTLLANSKHELVIKPPRHRTLACCHGFGDRYRDTSP